MVIIIDNGILNDWFMVDEWLIHSRLTYGWWMLMDNHDSQWLSMIIIVDIIVDVIIGDNEK